MYFYLVEFVDWPSIKRDTRLTYLTDERNQTALKLFSLLRSVLATRNLNFLGAGIDRILRHERNFFVA